MYTRSIIAAGVHFFAAAAFAIFSSQAAAADLSYFVGIDNQQTIPSGTYAGLPNPNYQRLTFLWGHPSEENPSGSHYHSKGIYRYTGENLGAATAVTFTVSDYVPEGTLLPLRLELGTGIYAGKRVTSPSTDVNDPAYLFSDLEIGSVHSLSDEPAGSAELFLFNSSGGRWNAAFDAADLHLELVGLTPGLHVGGLGGLSVGLDGPGDDLHLGEGADLFSFTPVLWVDETATPGIYEATFKLTDESGSFGDSGEFRIRTEVVPEPSSALALLSGLGVLLARRRRCAVAGK